MAKKEIPAEDVDKLRKQAGLDRETIQRRGTVQRTTQTDGQSNIGRKSATRHNSIDRD